MVKVHPLPVAFYSTSGFVLTGSMNREKDGVVECPDLPYIIPISRTLWIKRVTIFHFHLVLFQSYIFKMSNESISEHLLLHASLPTPWIRMSRVNSEKFQNFHFFSPNCHFRMRSTKIIARVNSRIFTNSSYIWFSKKVNT